MLRVAGLGLASKFEAIKERQRAQASCVGWLEAPAAQESFTVLGNAWVALQFETEFCICFPRSRQGKPRGGISCHPLHCFSE